jgi:hypothetical protein
MRHFRNFGKLLAWTVVWMGPTVQAAILIDNFSSLAHDRFSNDASFVADGYDLSGVAIADINPASNTSSTDGRWLTMVSRNVFLSVQHANFYPANGQNVSFYASNDPLGGSTTRTVQSSQPIGTSDVRIGVLDAPLPSSYAFYDYASATFDPTGFSAGTVGEAPGAPYYDQNAFIFGRSPTNWVTENDIAVGRNVLDRWVVDAAGTHDAIAAIRDSSGDTNYSSSEAYLQTGDSGGPLMVDNGSGGLTIVGLNWFINTLEDGSQINGFSYLGNYSDDIDAYIAAHPVPEPRQVALLLGLFAVLISIQRRNLRRH